MFGHFKLRFRQVKNLSALDSFVALFRCERPTTTSTLLRQMHFNTVRILYPLQGFSRMPFLASSPAPGRFRNTRTNRLFLVPITARWLIAVCTVQSQTTTQFGVLSFESLNFSPKLLY